MKSLVWMAAYLLAGALGFVALSLSLERGRGGAPRDLERGTGSRAETPSAAPDELRTPRHIPIEAPGPASTVPASRPDRSERTPVALAPMGGVLRDDTGAALAGAELAWTPLLPEYEGKRYLRDIDYDAVRSRTSWARSDSAGRFQFPEIPRGALERDSVVWVTQPGREAACVPVHALASGWSWTGALVAPARAICRVLVQRQGEPVPGAAVRQTLSFWDDRLQEGERRLRRVFLREFESGSDGAFALSAGPGENALQAFHGEESSLLWRDEPKEEIRLELLPSFRLSGIVLVDSGDGDFTGLRCSLGYFSKPDRSDLVWAAGSIPVRSDGGLGPDAWPRPDRARLLVHVGEGDLVPVEEELPLPASGSDAFVELHTTRGHALEVQVHARAGQPIDGAFVRASHSNGSTWEYLANKSTGEDGSVELRGLPAGQLSLEIGRDGFVTQIFDDHRAFLPRREEGPLQVRLSPAGVIEGHVLSAGAPVGDFVLVAWNDDLSYSPTRRVQDEGGAFRLADAPAGETVHLFAYTEGLLPQSETLTAVPAREPASLTLELPAPRRARGRVVDSLTQEPIATALVQHLTSGMRSLATWRGDPMPVEKDGSFELDGFFPGRGGFAVTAAGFESLFFNTREDDVDVIDVGLLALNPLSTIDIRVLDPFLDRSTSDYSSYRVWNRMNDDPTPVPINPDGTLRLPSRSGIFLLNLSRPDGTVASENGLVLPGEVVSVEFDFTRGIELDVLLSERPRDVETCKLAAFCRAGERERRIEARWSAEREAFALRGLASGDSVLELEDGAGVPLARRSLRLSDEPLQTITLELGGEKRRIRLVDERGNPWTPGAVHVSLPDASGWCSAHDLDTSGEFVVGPLAEQRVVLSAKLGSEYIAYGIPVELEPEASRTTVVTVDTGERSFLRLVEEGRACPGVDVAYRHDLAPPRLEFSYISDEQGLVRGPLCRRDTYRVRINHKGYWPTRYPIVPHGPSEPTVLELRSRGTLEFQVTDLTGQAIPGATLELVHEDLGESAAAWLDAGLIARPASGFSTDEHGRLALEGVPRGRYSWTWTSPDGARASGETQLAPRDRTTIAVRIDSE